MSYKLLIFDVDGTICKSKQDVSREMAVKIKDLSEFFEIAFISGCGMEQMKEQVWEKTKKFLIESHWHHGFYNTFHFLPMSGSCMWKFYAELRHIYENKLILRDKVKIYNAWETSVKTVGGWSSEVHGEIAEDRGSQITFSMCGQEAPLEIKQKYDSDQSKRKRIVKGMEALGLAESFSIKIGGTTSIDVTKKGLDKKYGISRLLSETGYKPEECIFFGDALYEGGNDAPVKETGIKCVQVTGPDDTLAKLKELI